MQELLTREAKESVVNTDLDTALDDLLESIDEQQVKELGLDPEHPPIKLLSEEQAEYYTKLYKQAQEEMAAINKKADDFIKKQTEMADKFRQGELNRLTHVSDYCTGLLEQYADEQCKKTGKKSLKLIYGTLGFRSQPDSYEYDDTVIKECLKNMGDAGEVYIKPQPAKVDHSALKKTGKVMKGKLYLDGIPVDGVVITPKPPKFSVK